MRAARQDMWTPVEIAELDKLFAGGMARKMIVVEMNARFPRKGFTKMAVIGRLNRNAIEKGHVPKKRVLGVRAPRKPASPRGTVYAAPKIHYLATSRLPPVYMKLGTCEFITSDFSPWTKCSKECRGSWCEKHRQIVMKRKIAA